MWGVSTPGGREGEYPGGMEDLLGDSGYVRRKRPNRMAEGGGGVMAQNGYTPPPPHPPSNLLIFRSICHIRILFDQYIPV